MICAHVKLTKKLWVPTSGGKILIDAKWISLHTPHLNVLLSSLLDWGILVHILPLKTFRIMACGLILRAILFTMAFVPIE
jgi:hypothetical protein